MVHDGTSKATPDCYIERWDSQDPLIESASQPTSDNSQSVRHIYLEITVTLHIFRKQRATGQALITSESQADPESQSSGATDDVPIKSDAAPPTSDTTQANGPATDTNAGALPAPLDSAKQDLKPDNSKGAGGDNPKGQTNAIENLQAKFTPAKRSRVWDIYVKKTEEEDKDLVEDWDR